jgi:sensor domain CHASE-containing protein
MDVKVNKQQILLAIVAAFFAGIVSASVLNDSESSLLNQAVHQSHEQVQAY